MSDTLRKERRAQLIRAIVQRVAERAFPVSTTLPDYASKANEGPAPIPTAQARPAALLREVIREDIVSEEPTRNLGFVSLVREKYQVQANLERYLQIAYEHYMKKDMAYPLDMPRITRCIQAIEWHKLNPGKPWTRAEFRREGIDLARL